MGIYSMSKKQALGRDSPCVFGSSTAAAAVVTAAAVLLLVRSNKIFRRKLQ